MPERMITATLECCCYCGGSLADHSEVDGRGGKVVRCASCERYSYQSEHGRVFPKEDPQDAKSAHAKRLRLDL